MEATTIIADSSSSTSTAAPTKSTGTISWLGGPSRKQYFSLPLSMMYYIARNPSSRHVYRKLVQSCKYFFERLPLLVARRLHSDGTKICAKSEASCAKKNHSCCVNIDLQKITSRIWLSLEIELTGNGSSDIIPILLSKLYQSELFIITLDNKNILYDDLKYLASSAQYIGLENTKVIYNDGTPVMLDKIIEVCPHLLGFSYDFIPGFPVINNTTFKAITKLDNFKNITTICLGYIPEACDVDDFCTIVRAHEYERLVCCFDLFDMSEDYKAKVDAFCDDVIKSEVLGHFIIYPGQNEKTMEIMASRKRPYQCV